MKIISLMILLLFNSVASHKFSYDEFREFLSVKKRENSQGFEQCFPVNFIMGQLGVVNVLAFLDNSWAYSHKQAALFKLLKDRLNHSGLPEALFYVIIAGSSPNSLEYSPESEIEKEAWEGVAPEEAAELSSGLLTYESLDKTISPDIFVIEDTEELGIWRELHGSRDQILVIDRCGKLAYQVIVPWSILHFPYVKAAILSTHKDDPCGPCDSYATVVEFDDVDESEKTVAIETDEVTKIEIETTTIQNEANFFDFINSENEKFENEKIENEKIENEKIENEKIEKIENEKIENEKIENEKIEKIENEKIENEKIENEKFENEKFENGKIENEQIDYEKIENEKIENEKIEKIENEKIKKIENEKIENEKIENKKIENEKIDFEKIENQKIDHELPGLRIIMHAPHTHLNSETKKKHEYLVLDSEKPNYHGHLDVSSDNYEEIRSEMEKSVVESIAFGKDESPGLFGEVADFWRDIPEYERIYEGSGEAEETTKDLEISTTPENLMDEAATNSAEFTVEGEESRSKIIAHYSKLLPWIYYVLD